jgi:D-sedoheptulose 7-phosphate isomerase
MAGTRRAEAVRGHLEDVTSALQAVRIDTVEAAVAEILAAHRRARCVYVVGNGGSATTASHFACDLSKATIVEGMPRVRVISLTDNAALITAWANDAGYERVFAEQLLNLVTEGDVVVAFTVSGRSPNVLAAMAVASELEARTIAFLGCRSPASLHRCVDVAVHVPSDDFRVVEDCHLALAHAITASTRQALQSCSLTTDRS